MSALPRLHLTASPWVIDLLTHLWQSTAVALAILLLLAACRRISARTRRTLGWIALVKFALPAAALAQLARRLVGPPQSWLATDSLPLPVNLPADAMVAASPATIWAAPAWLWPLLAGLWMAGTTWLLAQWIARGIRVRRELLAEARPVAETVAQAVANAAAQVGLRAAPRCVEVGRNHGPGAVGIVSPILILPRGLATTVSAAERDAILIHECVHLQRHDNLWGAVRAAFVGLLWFNPIAWLLSRAIAIETEKSCDERVLEITGDADTYARSIVASVRHTLGLVQPGFAGATTPPVLARIKAILAYPARPDRPAARWAAVAVAVALVMFSGRAGSIATASGAAPTTNAEPERAAPPNPANATPEPTLSVDFPDEDIRNIIRNVADLFQLNVIIPDTLQGRMTIKLRNATWRRIFEVVLEPTGFTFVEEKNIIRIFHRDSPPGSATRKLGTITIMFAGAAGVTEQTVRAAMQLREGGEFNESALDRDIRAIYRLGGFKSVEVKHARVDGSTYDLVFELTTNAPAPNAQPEGNEPPPAGIRRVETKLDDEKKKLAEVSERIKRQREERAELERKRALDVTPVVAPAAAAPAPAGPGAATPLRSAAEEVSEANRLVAEANAELQRMRDDRAAALELQLMRDRRAVVLVRQKELLDASAREAAAKTPPAPTPPASPGTLAPEAEKSDLRPRLTRSPVIAAAVPVIETPAIHRGMRVFDVSALDQKPVARFQARPQYPYAMRRSGISGEAVVDFIIDTNGDVQNAFAIRSSQREFEAAAVQAVSKWRFKPGQKDGRAVPTHMQVPIVFTLNER